MNPNPNAHPGDEADGSSTMAIALAWLFVGVPLIWGVSQTFIKALTLFK